MTCTNFVVLSWNIYVYKFLILMPEKLFCLTLKDDKTSNMKKIKHQDESFIIV